MKKELEKAVEGVVRNPLNFEVGDTVNVHYKIIESGKERVQIYEGQVISISNAGVGKSFTVRRISYNVGVERIFPLHSPRIARVELVRKGKVRKAKLYYLRKKTGKAARIKERKSSAVLVAQENQKFTNKVAKEAKENKETKD